MFKKLVKFVKSLFVASPEVEEVVEEATPKKKRACVPMMPSGNKVVVQTEIMPFQKQYRREMTYAEWKEQNKLLDKYMGCI